MKTATITTGTRGQILALDENGNRVASRSTYCNPAALAQLICEVETAGFAIDWAESTVAQPET